MRANFIFMHRRLWQLVVCLAAALSLCGCSLLESGPEKHLKKADQYFADGKYEEAAIEYFNALKKTPEDPAVLLKISKALLAMGRLEEARKHLAKAATLQPDDLEVRLRFGQVLLLSRESEKARAEADFILKKDPNIREALLLLAATSVSGDALDDAIKRLEKAKAEGAAAIKLHIALGNLYLRKGEWQLAQGQYEKALSVDPASVDAYLAMANLAYSKRNVSETEKFLQKAYDLNRDAAPVVIKLAQARMLLGEHAEATGTLKEFAQRHPDALVVHLMLARIALGEKRFEDCFSHLQPILDKDRNNMQALLLRAEALLVQGKRDEAMGQLDDLVKIYPSFPGVRYAYGVAAAEVGDTLKAKGALQEAIRLYDKFTEARARLAIIDIATGNPAAAIELLKPVSEYDPNNLQVKLLLGTAYVANKEYDKGDAFFNEYVKVAPKDARGPYLQGLAKLGQGEKESAKELFENALRLDSDFAQPLSQLVSLHSTDKGYETAIELVKKQMVLAPQTPEFPFMLGKLYVVAGRPDLAELSFEDALKRDPDHLKSRLELASLYMASNRLEEAKKTADIVLAKNPDDVLGLMLLGNIHQTKGEMPQAMAAFERALEKSPGFVPAANNLAYLYSEYKKDQDKALELAQTAKLGAPKDPQVADTLGWIYYHKGDFERALIELKSAAQDLPENGEVLYHLGMTHYKLGQNEKAREVLVKAVSLAGAAPWKGEAEKNLAQLR